VTAITYENWNKARDLLAAPLGDWLHYEIQRRNKLQNASAVAAARAMEDQESDAAALCRVAGAHQRGVRRHG
jgi:hypothetical protein